MLNFLHQFARDPARSRLASINHTQIAATIERDGLFDAPAEFQPRSVISERDLAALPAYACHSEVPALAANLPLLKQHEISPTQHYACFRLKDYLDNAAMLDLLFDRNLFQIARCYLGERFHIAAVILWKSFSTGTRAEAAQQFHRDHKRKKSLALFLYLNDVYAENGPHSYVRGSHKFDTFAHALAQSDAPGLDDDRRAEILHHSYIDDGYSYPLDEAMATYAPHLVHTKIGPAGGMLLTEPGGLHRGDPVRAGYRLMLSVRWHRSNPGFGAYDKGSLYSLLSSRVEDDTTNTIAADIQRLYDRTYVQQA
jgi:hypothetical protein